MKRRIIKWSLLVLATAVCILAMTYWSVSWNASGLTFDNAKDVPAHEYGLLLGTSPITPRGKHNYNFDNRINAAAELYRAGKIRKIIASGGNYTRDENGKLVKYGCDEPKAMRDSLVAKGVRPSDITLDYDGTRTIYSIAKARDVYKLDTVILISQKYHNERAIRQAEHYGLTAVGYNAPPSHITINKLQSTLRETFARVKLYGELWFTATPHFCTPKKPTNTDNKPVKAKQPAAKRQ